MDGRIQSEAESLLGLLRERNLTVSAAESCTGGMIGSSITSFPGASANFLGGAVVYSNEAKENILGVPRGVLFAYGAVSPQTARCMSEGAVRVFGSDVAVAVTGIAGPGGGTAEKPVGLVYISVSDGVTTVTERSVFGGDREEVRTATAAKALAMLRAFIAENL